MWLMQMELIIYHNDTTYISDGLNPISLGKNDENYASWGQAIETIISNENGTI